MVERESILFCISGPTASGKSTVCRYLKDKFPDLNFSVSTTTRSPRPGEVDGREYYFVSKEEFQQKIDKGDFVEHAEFSGNFYGTDLKNLEGAKSSGKDLLLEIEVQGVSQLKEKMAEGVVTIFLFPVSFAELEKRLRDRNTESEEQIQTRLDTARKEVELLSKGSFSDYLVINDDLDKACQEVAAIITAETRKLSRYGKGYLSHLLTQS